MKSVWFCRLLLRGVALLAPRAEREEWLAEWNAELWHLSHRVLASHEAAISDGEDDADTSSHISPLSFCLGALPDALSLRRNAVPHSRPVLHSSPVTCLYRLAAWTAAALVLGLCLPSARQVLLPSPNRDAGKLVLVLPGAVSASERSTIRLADYLAWRTSTKNLFSELGFYQLMFRRVHVAPHQTAELSIVRASASMAEMLHLPIAEADGATARMPSLLISESTCRRVFKGSPEITGRVVEVSGSRMRIAGIVPDDLWQLPGHPNGWIILSDKQLAGLSASNQGSVLAHIRPSSFPSPSSGRHWMTVYRANGDAETFECLSLAEIGKQPLSIFLFTLLVACLALPATTPLPLGDYPDRAKDLATAVRLRRWGFLVAKILLILPLVYIASMDVAYGSAEFGGVHALGTEASQYLELASSFFGLLFGFRWALRDQRGRCPVCLRQLTNPARVGEASRNFLAWNGTELICTGGHGLLHIPEIPTSWFSCQRWLYLDPSWNELFSDTWGSPARLRL
jgi:hypothetical protein